MELEVKQWLSGSNIWEEGGNPLGSEGLQQEAKENFLKEKMPPSNFQQI